MVLRGKIIVRRICCFVGGSNCLSLGVEFVRTPGLVTWLYPRRCWRMRDRNRVLYLTFDDGPTPGITEFVLDTLSSFGAKATFFCIGDNIRRHPVLGQRIRAEGHSVGNHTQTHLNGWKTPGNRYLADVAAGQESLKAVLGQGSGLFRPPYGKAGCQSARQLLKTYQVIMWDVLPGDFHLGRSPEIVTNHILEKSRSGSLVVLHDSIKCAEKVRYTLPRVLAYFQEKGYVFAAIPDPLFQGLHI